MDGRARLIGNIANVYATHCSATSPPLKAGGGGGRRPLPGRRPICEIISNYGQHPNMNETQCRAVSNRGHRCRNCVSGFRQSDQAAIMAAGAVDGATFEDKRAHLNQHPDHPLRHRLDRAFYCSFHLGQERRMGPSSTARGGWQVRRRNWRGRLARSAADFPVGHKLACANAEGRHQYTDFAGFAGAEEQWGVEGQGLLGDDVIGGDDEDGNNDEYGSDENDEDGNNDEDDGADNEADIALRRNPPRSGRATLGRWRGVAGGGATGGKAGKGQI